nr:hypothetical protein CFP56_41859 [Quercus suber]
MILNLSNRPYRKPGKRRFLFEAMWTRDERCREVVELAWNPLGGDPSSPIMDRVKRCQVQLQSWNWNKLLVETEEGSATTKAEKELHHGTDGLRGEFLRDRPLSRRKTPKTASSSHCFQIPTSDDGSFLALPTTNIARRIELIEK